jgi:hypothetical protein
MQQASLDESGRYLLVGATGKRTFLVDLLDGDVSVISGMDAGWQVAR